MKLSTITNICPETLESDRLNRLTKVIQETLGNAYTLVKILDICIKKQTTKVRCICSDIEWDDQKVRSITFKNSELKAKIELVKAEEEKALQEEKVAEEAKTINKVRKYLEPIYGKLFSIKKVEENQNAITFELIGERLSTTQMSFTHDTIARNFLPDPEFQKYVLDCIKPRHLDNFTITALMTEGFRYEDLNNINVAVRLSDPYRPVKIKPCLD